MRNKISNPEDKPVASGPVPDERKRNVRDKLGRYDYNLARMKMSNPEGLPYEKNYKLHATS